MNKIKKIIKKIILVIVLIPLLGIYISNPADGFFVTVGDNSFKSLIMFIIQSVLLPIVGIISVLFIILGGFQYITSHGNEEQAEAGKKTLTNAIIGLVIVILSYIIVTVILNALGKLK